LLPGDNDEPPSGSEEEVMSMTQYERAVWNSVFTATLMTSRGDGAIRSAVEFAGDTLERLRRLKKDAYLKHDAREMLLEALPDPPPLLGLEDPRIRDRESTIVIDRDGRRRILRVCDEVEPGDVFACSRPHGDGRFDYLCGGRNCRCSQ
jgi:hypothetical protein